MGRAAAVLLIITSSRVVLQQFRATATIRAAVEAAAGAAPITSFSRTSGEKLMETVKALTTLGKSGVTQPAGTLAVETWSSRKGTQTILGAMRLAAEEETTMAQGWDDGL